MTVSASARQHRASLTDHDSAAPTSLDVVSTSGPDVLSSPRMVLIWVGWRIRFLGMKTYPTLGTAFKEIRAPALYPSVGMKKPGEHIRVNFGQTPFIFDIDTMVAVSKRW